MKKRTKLSALAANKTLVSTTILPEGEAYRVRSFYLDNFKNQRITSFLSEEIVEDLELKDNSHLLPIGSLATKALHYKADNGYYINFYKR